MSVPAASIGRLFHHRASSASLRVTIYLSCCGISEDEVALTSTGLATDHRGILVFTMPDGDPETLKAGTTDLTAFNPEGRVPILLLNDGRKLTQTGPIIEYLEAVLPGGKGAALTPADPWARAEMHRIMWIVAADIQPYQNIPFIIQAMSEWGIVKADPTAHPLRLHYIRREFGALEHILARSAGKFAVGDQLTQADCFLVPQIRNALLAEIDLAREFPNLAQVWENAIAEPRVQDVLEASGGVIQPLAFDRDRFEVYSD